MDYGARQGAGDSLNGLDFVNDKLPESINVCRLHPHNHVVGAGKDVGGANARDTAELRGYSCLFRDLGLDENVSFDHCFSLKALPGLNRSPADDNTVREEAPAGAGLMQQLRARTFARLGPRTATRSPTALKNDRIAWPHPPPNRQIGAILGLGHNASWSGRSACDAASWTSLSGTPASRAAVMNVCRNEWGLIRLPMPARSRRQAQRLSELEGWLTASSCGRPYCNPPCIGGLQASDAVSWLHWLLTRPTF